METNARIVAKAVCWQISGLMMMTLIGLAFTGSISAGGALALVTTGIGTIAYFVHEKIWARVRWGRGEAVHPR